MVTVELANGRYQVNVAFAHSIAIEMAFNAPQPNHFGADIATATPMQAGGFIGDTQQGGSCNVNQLSLNPHCNGTHTETLAHICDKDSVLSLTIADIDIPPLLPCSLISVMPQNGIASGEQYRPELTEHDEVISRQQLEHAMADIDDCQLTAVVIRTLPNDNDKCTRAYNEQQQPPFLTADAVLYLNERGVEHVLLDVPSVDRLHDDGLMTCHHLFWQVPEGSHQAGPHSLVNKTITEMAFIDDHIADGFYFLNLQMPAFINDAAPSRPVLYAAQRLDANL
ncbi:cyclase family protein [Aliiglaciecola litoralis]|uniref:Cyclase family protein n=1 Tax=Aliiglaciecola litoralis TaxID=582857 RepID=A0ABN1LHU2_9ALTE